MKNWFMSWCDCCKNSIEALPKCSWIYFILTMRLSVCIVQFGMPFTSLFVLLTETLRKSFFSIFLQKGTKNIVHSLIIIIVWLTKSRWAVVFYALYDWLKHQFHSLLFYNHIAVNVCWFHWHMNHDADWIDKEKKMRKREWEQKKMEAKKKITSVQSAWCISEMSNKSQQRPLWMCLWICTI